jgi:hypothetical protein
MEFISPDGKWKVEIKWTQLTQIKEPVKIKQIDTELEKSMKGNWTVKEIVASMKRSYPEIWKK